MNRHFYMTGLLAFTFLWGGWNAAQAQDGLKPALERAAIKAEQKHRLQTAVAEVQVRWEKAVYLSDWVARRRTGFKDTLLKKERQTTVCRGVLAEGEPRVLTPASCLDAPKGFTLQALTVSFANGQKETLSQQQVTRRGGLAVLAVSSQVTRGLKGAPLAAIAPGKTLAETFGNGVLDELLQFFINRGVVSARANRLTGTKNTLRVGEPFFYRGKLVALVNQVPRRLPVSFWGGVSEEPLVLVRVKDTQALYTNR